MECVPTKYHEKHQHLLEIVTLGQFSLNYGGLLISDISQRSNKLWELFKYLLTNQGKRIPSEMIVDTLWPKEEYADSKSAVYDLIYRLQKILKNSFPVDEKPIRIEFIQGSYVFQLGTNCLYDARDFVRLSETASRQVKNDPIVAIDTLRKAISLYKGTYLPEYFHREWLLPARYYYRRLYLNNVLQLLKLLKSGHLYQDIKQVCESALLIENFLEEENIHLYYIEALAEEDEIGNALAHYEYITALLLKEIGINPSPAMREMHRKLKKGAEVVDTDLLQIRSRLQEQHTAQEAFVCDRDFFHILYRLDKYRCERSGRSNQLGLLTVTLKDYGFPEHHILSAAMGCLKRVLISNLRKGDAICIWNEAQILVLFPDINYERAESVLKRVKADFNKSFTQKGIVLRSQVQSAFPSK